MSREWDDQQPQATAYTALVMVAITVILGVTLWSCADIADDEPASVEVTR